MSKKDDMVYIGHMLEMALKAQFFIHNKTRADFNRDEILRLALTRILQIIGEAARLVSKPFQEAHPHIAWKEIIGFRNVVVHNYLDVDEDIVWVAATTDINELIPELEKLNPPMRDDHPSPGA